MNYRCLILDHDDTAVDSTAKIHYPAYLELMRRMRPEMQALSLVEWFEVLYDPGLDIYYRETLGFNQKELENEYHEWLGYAKKQEPEFFEGFLELLSAFYDAGGIFAVVSHSNRELILRDYKKAGLLPSHVFDWYYGVGKMTKPFPDPVLKIMKDLEISSTDILVVDDMKPGIAMANSAGVDSAYAAWSHNIPAVQEYMRKAATYSCQSMEELQKVVLG